VTQCTLVQFWDVPEAPGVIEGRMRGCLFHNPFLRYQRFDRLAAADFLSTAFGSHVASAFLDINIPAMMADVFRVAYLLKEGGLWMDAATTCQGSLACTLARSQRLKLLRKKTMEPPRVWNGFIHAPSPEHPFLRAAWEHIEDLITRRSGSNIHRDVGPGLFTRLMSTEKCSDEIEIIHQTELAPILITGSSGKVMPRDLHWSRRQQHEPLYRSKTV
jgi:mannosyltransferase OCH1-like enzyme